MEQLLGIHPRELNTHIYSKIYDEGWEESELDKGSQKYKIPVNTRDVMYNRINIINTAFMLFTKVVKRVNPNSSHHKEKYFLLFL